MEPLGSKGTNVSFSLSFLADTNLIFVRKNGDLRLMDTFRDLVAIFHKGDNFYDFLYAFLHTSPLLKRSVL